MASFEETIEKAVLAAVERAVKRAKLEAHPVGSLYLSLASDNPKDLLGGGTWVKVGSGRCLWGADDANSAGTEIAAGLPNIEGWCAWGGNGFPESTFGVQAPYKVMSGALSVSKEGKACGQIGASGSDSTNSNAKVSFDASASNALYGASDTVQPPALAVNIWRRTA